MPRATTFDTTAKVSQGKAQSSLPPPVEVTVRARYAPERSNPSRNLWFFLYTISIKNCSSEPVQLMSRRWIITDAHGGSEEVKGPGVVGKQPKLGPDQAFEYTSGCPLNTAFGSMHGWYQMVTEDGTEFEVPIPGFALRDPRNMQ
jgi:ApaG protein